MQTVRAEEEHEAQSERLEAIHRRIAELEVRCGFVVPLRTVACVSLRRHLNWQGQMESEVDGKEELEREFGAALKEVERLVGRKELLDARVGNVNVEDLEHQLQNRESHYAFILTEAVQPPQAGGGRVSGAPGRTAAASTKALLVKATAAAAAVVEDAQRAVSTAEATSAALDASTSGCTPLPPPTPGCDQLRCAR